MSLDNCHIGLLCKCLTSTCKTGTAHQKANDFCHIAFIFSKILHPTGRWLAKGRMFSYTDSWRQPGSMPQWLPSAVCICLLGHPRSSSLVIAPTALLHFAHRCTKAATGDLFSPFVSGWAQPHSACHIVIVVCTLPASRVSLPCSQPGMTMRHGLEVLCSFYSHLRHGHSHQACMRCPASSGPRRSCICSNSVLCYSCSQLLQV